MGYIRLHKKNENDYFSYLVQKAWQSHFIDKQRVQKINEEMLYLLKKTIASFAGGDASVSKARGQALMDSMVSTIAFYLRSCDEKEAMDKLVSTSIDSLYHEAKQCLKETLFTLQNTCHELQKDILDIDLKVYTDTVSEGLLIFFTVYNFDYDVNDVVLTFDYPTFLPIYQNGIEKVVTYVNYIKIEHQCYQYFNQNEMIAMIQQYQPGYQYLIFNITELLWKQLILKDMAKSEGLILTWADMDRLYNLWDNSKKNDIYTEVGNSFYRVCQQYQIYERTIIRYIEKGMDNLCAQIYYGLTNRNIEVEAVVQ